MKNLNEIIKHEVDDLYIGRIEYQTKKEMGKFLTGLNFSSLEEILIGLVHDLFIAAYYLPQNLWGFIPQVVERIRNATPQHRDKVFDALSLHTNRHIGVDPKGDDEGLEKFLEFLPKLLLLADEELEKIVDRYQEGEELINIYTALFSRP